MGKFDFEIPAGFLDTLGRMQDVDRLAPKMIDGAIPILEVNVKKEITVKMFGSHYSTGDMLASVKKTKAKRTKSGGYFAAVRPTGVDRKGVRNMEKLVYGEYGTSKQTPKPILTKAIKDSESPVFDVMQDIFNREVVE